MVFSLKSKTQQGQVNVAEVSNLWDLLVSNFQTIENFKVFLNFAHDSDLKLLLTNTLTDLEGRTKHLLKLMKKFSIKAIEAPRAYVHTSTNTEVIYDEQIAQWLLLLAQERLEMKLRAIRTSVTNDEVRKLFIKFCLIDIDTVSTFIKYSKLKGWLNQPPIYPLIPTDSNEVIDVGEAFHLWDHLTFRYNNIEKTEIYYAFAHDGDFKLLLKNGIQNILKKQARVLEKEGYKFGLPSPKKPPENTQTRINTELLDDDYMFGVVLEGMQGAAIMHAQALKQAVTNDRIRNLFASLLKEEIDLTDMIIKYGKVKGWYNQPPQFTLQG